MALPMAYHIRSIATDFTILRAPAKGQRQVPNLASDLQAFAGNVAPPAVKGASPLRHRFSILFAPLTVVHPSAAPPQSDSVARYGSSMADIPLTTGQPDHGAGAYQFTGYTIYDPLVAGEMNVADRPGKLVPGLATEWKVDDTDKT